MFLFVNQIEKEDQDYPTEKVREDFQANGPPQDLDSLLLDPRAFGQVIQLPIWCGRRHLLMWQLPMPTVPLVHGLPGSLPGGERGHLCASCSIGGSQQRPLGPRAQCVDSLVSAVLLSFPEHAQTSGVFGSGWSSSSPCLSSNLSSPQSLACCCLVWHLTFFFVTNPLPGSSLPWIPCDLLNQFLVLAHSQRHSWFWGRSKSFWVSY